MEDAPTYASPLNSLTNFITYNFNFFQLHNIFRFTLQQELALQNYRNTSETETHFLGGIDRTIYFAIENRKDFLKIHVLLPTGKKHEMTQNGLHNFFTHIMW